MKNDTDQQLRAILEAADPTELIPAFDLEEGWRAVQQKRKPGPVLLLWIKRALPYAAVLVLGILLAEMIGPVLHSGEEHLVAVRQLPLPTLRKDTLQLASPAPVTRALALAPAHPAKQKKTYTPEVPADTFVPAETPVTALAVAPAVPASLPVRHYIDVVGDLTPAPGQQYASQKQKKHFLRSRIARQSTEIQGSRKDELPLRGLLYALNQ